jgi:RNA polymerase sigma-70 factor (ECF subfamily)
LDASEREELQRAMTALAAGERSRFRAVFGGLWPVLRRFCERMLKDPDRGKDAAQAALMKLFLNAGEFDPARDAVSWALGFAAFECLSERNRWARRREERDEETMLATASPAPDPESTAIALDLEAAALAAVERLRPSDIAVLEEALEGRRRVAGATFRKRLQRALERLRVVWRNTHGLE